MRPIIATSLLLAIVACQKEEEKVEMKPEGSLFAAADLEPGDVNTTDGKYIGDMLGSDSTFQAGGDGAMHLAEGEDDGGETETCIQDKVDALVIDADEANVRISDTVDFKECLSSMMAGLDVTDATMKVRLWIGCENEDLAALDGKTLGEARNNPAKDCVADGGMHALFNVDMSMALSGSFDIGEGGEVELAMEMRALTAQQTSAGKPCDATASGSDWAWSDDCKVVSRDITVKQEVNGEEQEDSGKEDYLSVDYVSIVEDADPDKTWFKSGRFDVTYNDWSGTVTYTDADTAPTYSMSNGSTVKTGSLGTSSSALRGKAPSRAAAAVAMARSRMRLALTGESLKTH